MRIKFLLLCSLLLHSVACFSALPAWYINQNIIPDEKSIYVGYGEGVSIQRAKQAARSDISAQLLIVVDSEMKIEKNSTMEGLSLLRSSIPSKKLMLN